MEEIVNKYTSKTFEDIKHIDEYGGSTGLLVICKKFWNIKNGEISK